MIVRILLTLLLVFFMSAPSANAAELAIDMAQDHVDITAGFTGDDLILFGTKTIGADVAVTIKGPPKTMVVRRKDRVFGVWINRKSVEFTDVPGYYNYALSDNKIMLSGAVKTYAIGTENIPILTADKIKPDAVKVFQESLIRNKQAQDLFPLEPENISFLTEEFFRTRFSLPPNVPMGDYIVTTYLLNEGVVVNEKSMTVNVAQVGTSAFVNHFAHKRALLYGILCIIFAVAIGWLSYAVRQRLR